MTTPFERPSADAPLRADWRDLTGAVPAPGPHLSEDDWVQLAGGELDDATRQRCADHIEACAVCADVFRAVAALRAGAPAIDPAAPAYVPESDDAADLAGSTAGAPSVATPDSSFTPRVWWYGLAAAAVLALALGATLWRGSPATEPVTRVAGSAATAPVTSGPTAAPDAARAGTDAAAATAGNAAPAVTGSAQPVPAWAVLASAPAVVLPPSLTLVMRGAADVDREAFLAAFGPAIAPYRARRYDEAARTLTDLTRQFPAVSEGWFYLGVSQLHAGRAGEAVEPLRRAQASEVVADDARWLTAVALAHAGRTEDAMATVRTVCGAAGPHRDAACAAAGRPR